METLTLIRNVVGNIVLFFVLVWVLYLVYHLFKAVVVGWDLYKWRMVGASQEKMDAMTRWQLITGKLNLFYNCWVDTIGYNGSITYSRGGSRWEGYGTGR